MVPSAAGKPFRSASMALPPNSIFAGRYRILRVAGAGGMGRIYEAIDQTNGGRVALKTVTVTGVDSVVAERFEREIAILRSVSHPNLVQALDRGRDDDGSLYLALEWLDGMDLGDRLLKGKLDAAEACRVGRGVLRGLSMVHRVGVVHRDMKPGNIFLLRGVSAPTGVKLLDFGVAKILEDQLRSPGGSLTLEGTVIGTPYYMSPEQAQGRDDVGPRADLFSLASVLFECITGLRPFSGSSALALLLRIASDKPRPIRDVDPTLPAPVGEFFRHALERDPAQRFQSAEEMEAALGQLELELEALSDPTAAEGREEDPFRWSSEAETQRPTEEPKGKVQSIPPEVSGELATLAPPPIEPQPLSVLVAELLRAQEDPAAPANEASESAFAAFRTQVETEGGEALPVRGRVAIGVFAGTRDGPERACRVGRRVVMVDAHCAVRAAVGTVGADERGAEERAGAAIESAVSLVTLASPREVVLDEETFTATRARFSTLPRGKSARVVVEDALSAEDSSEPLIPIAGMTGRKKELERLVEAFERCAESRSPAFWLISGPGGLGRSRLASELARKIARGPIKTTVLSGLADGAAVRTPLFLFVDALRRRTVITSSETEITIAAKLDLLVPKSVGAENREGAVAAIAELVGAPGSSDALHAIDRPESTSERSSRSFAALVRTLVGLASEGPTALILDDAHFIDPSSAALVEELLDTARGLPLFIAAFADPTLREKYPRLFGISRTLDLKPLDSGAIESMALAVRTKALEPEQLDKLVQRSRGCPALVLALLAAKDELTSSRNDDGPTLLTRLARARIESLSHRQRLTLEHAAAIGPVFWDDALRALGLTEAFADLERLAALGIIETRETSRYPMTRERAFRTGTLWEAARNKEVERGAGRRIASWLRSQSFVSAEMVASQLMRAEAWHEAASSWLDAAKQALGANDATSAESLSKQGLEVPDAHGASVDLTEVRIKALDLLAEFREIDDLLDSLELEELAPSRKVTQKARRARLARRTGELAHAARLYREALTALEASDRFEEAAESALGLEATLQERGETVQAVGFAEQAYRLAKRCENAQLEVRSLLALGRIAFATADIGQALRLIDQAKTRTKEGDLRSIEGLALKLSGAALAMAGANDRAQLELVLAERRLATVPDIVGTLEARIFLASLESDVDPRDRIETLEVLFNEAETCGCPTPMLLAGAFLARFQLDAGLEVEAAALGDQLLTMAQKKAPRFLVSLESTVGLAEARLGAPSGRKRVESALRRMEAQKSSENDEPFRIYARYSEVLELSGESALAEKQWKRTTQILKEVTSRIPDSLRAGFARRPIVRFITERSQRR